MLRRGLRSPPVSCRVWGQSWGCWGCWNALGVSGEVCPWPRGGRWVGVLQLSWSGWEVWGLAQGLRAVCVGVGSCNARGKIWGGAPAAVLPPGQFCALPGDPPPQVLPAGAGGVSFCSTGPLCPIQQGWGVRQVVGNPKSQLGLHLQGTEREKRVWITEI